MNVKLIDTPKLELGEGTVWNAETGCILFVDITGETVYEKNIETGVLRSFNIGGTVGFVAIEDKENLICARNSDLIRLDLVTGKVADLTDFGMDKSLRFNDAKCDKDGRLWAGTMLKSGAKPAESGALYCIENGKITFQIDGMTIPNGMDWFDGKFYHVDTPTKKIYQYEQNENELKQIKVVVDLSEIKGSPDGFCMDENGNIWVAIWGGNCVLCYDTKTGEILDKIEIPDECVSCCTFGGNNMNTMFITTATDENGNGGHLYSAELSVKGRKPNYIKFR